MKHSRILLSTLTAVAFLVGMFGTQDIQAQSQKAPQAKVTSLLRIPLEGVEGKDVIIKKFELPANFVGAKHWHPGPLFVYVLEGALTLELDEGVKTVKAGEVYAEPATITMIPKNLSTTGPTKVLAFLIGKSKKPFMINVK